MPFIKSLCSLLFIVFAASATYAQSQDSLDRDTLQDNRVFFAVEQQADFPGGKAALQEFYKKNIVYPKDARRMGVEGNVYVKFVINQNGTLSDIQIMKGIHASLDKEAIRIIEAFPNWVPARQNGRVVKSQYVLPVPFRLNK